ncbi:hypothetical protein DM49_3601 [Burkholderia mallei]|nr:hypothetical protein DM49_3601 [Burkholderia mallei]
MRCGELLAQTGAAHQCRVIAAREGMVIDLLRRAAADAQQRPRRCGREISGQHARRQRGERRQRDTCRRVMRDRSPVAAA